MVQKQEELPPLSKPFTFLSSVTPSKPDASVLSFRVRFFTHAISLVDDDSNVIRNMLQTNGIYTLFNNLSIPFKNIEDIQCRVNNTLQKLNIATTNRLSILKPFSINNERINHPLE